MTSRKAAGSSAYLILLVINHKSAPYIYKKAQQ
jgi:hypothetical protein